MIEQNVQVVRCQEDRLWVRMGSQSGCTACDNGKGCGAGIFAKLLKRRPVVLELDRNDLSVEPGQMLTLAFPEHLYLKLVFTNYGWPLLAALAGAVAGHGLATWLQVTPGWVDAGTLIVGLMAVGIAMLFIKRTKNEDAILNSLQSTVYYSSTTPNMCKESWNDIETN